MASHIEPPLPQESNLLPFFSASAINWAASSMASRLTGLARKLVNTCWASVSSVNIRSAGEFIKTIADYQAGKPGPDVRYWDQKGGCRGPGELFYRKDSLSVR